MPTIEHFLVAYYGPLIYKTRGYNAHPKPNISASDVAQISNLQLINKYDTKNPKVRNRSAAP